MSHHLGEVLDLADRITVLRDGEVVATVTPGALDERRLAELMIGRPLPMRSDASGRLQDRGREAVFEAIDVTRAPALGPISLTVRAGEVVCVAGLVGSGRRELARIAAFAEVPDSGEVRALGGTPGAVRDAVRAGVVFLSDDRKGEALLTGQTTHDNVAIGPLVTGAGRYRRAAIRRTVERVARSVGVTAGRLDDPIEHLSGGNQQKALLARWMAVGAKLYVLDEPTVGVDVGARAEIYGLLRAQASDGAGVLCFSSDFEEIRELADRAIVLRQGRIAGELAGDEIQVDGLAALQHGVA